MLLNILNLKLLSNAALLVLTSLAKEGAASLQSHQSGLAAGPARSRPPVKSALSPHASYWTSGSDPTCLASQLTQPLAPLPVSPGFACELPVVVPASRLVGRLAEGVLVDGELRLGRPAAVGRAAGLACGEGFSLC